MNVNYAMEDFLIRKLCHYRVNRFSGGVSIRDIKNARGIDRVRKLARFILNFDSSDSRVENYLADPVFTRILQDMVRPMDTIALYHSFETLTGYLRDWNLHGKYRDEIIRLFNNGDLEFNLNLGNNREDFYIIANNIIQRDIYETIDMDWYLADKTRPISKEDLDILIRDSDFDTETLLKMFARSGKTILVRFLIDNYSNIDIDIHADNDEALISASDMGHFEIVKLLIRRGADIHANDNEALHMASRSGHLEIVELLIRHGADIHADDNEALILASNNGHLEIVELLIRHGADIHAMDNEALHMASGSGHLEIVKLLLEQGADIHANNNEALHMASSGSGHFEIVKLLLEHGADIHALNDIAVRSASRSGHLEIVKLLLEHGADIHALNDIAVRLAYEYGHMETVQFLIDHGANLTQSSFIDYHFDYLHFE